MISYVYTVQHIYALYSVQVVRANGTPFSQGPTLADDTTRTRAISITAVHRPPHLRPGSYIYIA